MSDSAAKPKGKRDPVLITAIVIIIIAIVFFIISISILFAFGNRPDLADKRGQLLAGGAFIFIGMALAVVTAIIVILLVRKRSSGKAGKSLKWTAFGFASGTVVALAIGLILVFISANQMSNNPSEQAGVRAAGVFGILAFVAFVVAFIMFMVRGQRQQDIKAGGKGNYGQAFRSFGSAFKGQKSN